MKTLILLLVMIFSACSIQFNSSGKYNGNSGISSNIPSARVKYRDDLKDSLFVKYKGEEFTVALPNNKIRFYVACSTPEDIVLWSYDRKKFLTFVLKTRTWVATDLSKNCT